MSISGRRFKKLQASAGREADQRVPKRRRDWWALVCSRAASTSGWSVLGVPLFGATLFGEDSSAKLLLAGALLVGWVVLRALATELAGPRNARVAELSGRLLRESVSRAAGEQLEREKFYTTPEWRAIREVIIRRDGRVCRLCSRHIVQEFDITVDHIRPRSRFPELALDSANLQVLCRSCNASKGAAV